MTTTKPCPRCGLLMWPNVQAGIWECLVRRPETHGDAEGAWGPCGGTEPLAAGLEMVLRGAPRLPGLE
jgi:hypothetical protein